MNILKKQELLDFFEGAIEDALYEIEENRHTPSHIDPLDAPRDGAIEFFKKTMINLVNKAVSEQIDITELYKSETIEEVIETINNLSENDKEYRRWENIKSLKEIDGFSSVDDYSKYLYKTYIYQHVPSQKYISIQCKYSNPYEDPVFLAILNVNIVEKKEKITYEWI